MSEPTRRMSSKGGVRPLPRRQESVAEPSWLSVSVARAHLVFRWFGGRFASSPVGTLLCCAFVMCSFCYPALSTYFVASEGPGSPTVLATSSRGGVQLWEMEGMIRQGLLWSEDDVCWDRLAAYHASRPTAKRSPPLVRVEQLLIAPVAKRRTPALSKWTLHQAMLLEREISKRISDPANPYGIHCVSVADGQCAITSPTKWWSGEADLFGDSDIHQTLNAPTPLVDDQTEDDDAPVRNAAFPLSRNSVLVGLRKSATGSVQGSEYLSVTFFLREGPSSLYAGLSGVPAVGTDEEMNSRRRMRAAWRAVVVDVLDGEAWDHETRASMQLGTRSAGKRITLKLLPNLPVPTNPRMLEDVIFLLAYGLTIAYFLHTLRGLDQVHSRMGLCFTGVVDVAISSLMSVSVCRLLGWDIGLVPWKLVPFFVLVASTDNMFSITNAVTSTDVSLPVPERMANGLAQVGVSTTLNLIGEMLLLAFVLRYVTIKIWEELILYMIVAQPISYFMEMVFYTTVLSIDMQRLELADLLRQGALSKMKSGNGSPWSKSDEFFTSASTATTSTLKTILRSIRSYISARRARTTSMLVLIGINIGLYASYGPTHYLPAFCSEHALSKDRPLLGPSLSPSISNSLLRGQMGLPLIDDSVQKGAAQDLWNLLNPANATSIHLYVEPPSTVRFIDDSTVAPESITEPGPSPWSWTRALVILGPTALTMALLYPLLLYLLKDADLVELERGRTEAAAADQRKAAQDEASLGMVILKGKHEADVELLAQSRDYVVSWSGLGDHIVVSRLPTDARTSSGPSGATIGRLAIPVMAETPSFAYLAIDAEGMFCAAATRRGRIVAWSLARSSIVDFTPTVEQDPPITPSRSHLEYGPVSNLVALPLRAGGPGRQARRYGFLSSHTDGSFVLWDCQACRSEVVVPGEAQFETARMYVQSPAGQPDKLVLVRVSTSGRLQMWTSSAQSDFWSTWTASFDDYVTTGADQVSAVAAGLFDIGVQQKLERLALAVGLASGLVVLFDVVASSKVCDLALLDAPVRQIRLLESTHVTCRSCTELITDGLLAVCSSKTTVKVTRLFSPLTTSTSTACTCSLPKKLGLDLLAASTPKKGRKSSYSARRPPFDPLASPTATRSPKPDLPDNLVEGEPLLVVPGTLPVPQGAISVNSYGDIPLFNTSEDGTDTSPPPYLSSASPPWPEPWVSEVSSLSNDDRGGWELVGTKIIGVRRSKDKENIRSSVRWEIWTADLAGLIALDSTLAESATALERFLGSPNATQFSPNASRSASPAAQTAQSLRRRYSTKASASSASAGPTIRISDDGLPFSRVRPVVSGPAEVCLSMGIGDAIGLAFSTTKGRSGRVSGGRLRDFLAVPPASPSKLAGPSKKTS